jgi:plasmid maintenance system antidote protein VapI
MAVADNFAANLRKLVERMGGSVNGAAQAWKVPTKTLESVLKGQRVPSLDTAERLAKASGYELWQMIASNFDPANPPILRAVTKEEAALYDRLREMARHLPPQA